MTIPRRTALAAAAASLAAGCAPAAPRVLMAPADGEYEVRRDLRYAEGHARFALDLYVPHLPSAAPRPMLVYFYGGGWGGGEKTDPLSRTLPKDLAARGAVVAVPDYRLWPEATYPGFLQDGAAAVAWARAHAAEHGADPEGIFLIGHSTGATLAALLGLDPRWLREAGFGAPPPAGIIGISGPYRPWFMQHRIMRPVFGVAPDPDLLLPERHLRRDSPPLLLIAGTWDGVIDPGDSASLAEAARAAGADAELRLYPRFGHLDVLSAGPWMSSLAPTADDVADFVRRRHRGATAPAGTGAA